MCKLSDSEILRYSEEEETTMYIADSRHQCTTFIPIYIYIYINYSHIRGKQKCKILLIS